MRQAAKPGGLGRSCQLALEFNPDTAIDFLDGHLQTPLLLLVFFLAYKTHIKSMPAQEGCCTDGRSKALHKYCALW